MLPSTEGSPGKVCYQPDYPGYFAIAENYYIFLHLYPRKLVGPLGRFGLVVAMPVCLSVCGLSPSHAIFFCMDQGGVSLVHGLVRSLSRPRVEP